MSEVGSDARRIAGALLPEHRRFIPPDRGAVDSALEQLATLEPADAYDEVVLHEVAETLLRLRDAASPK